MTNVFGGTCVIFAILGFFHSFFIFSQISNGETFPTPLSLEEEQHWLTIFKNGNDDKKEEAKCVLVEHNLRLVAHIVKKYPNYGKDVEDLISIGTIGLIKAVTTFKNDKGTRLATYAARCIENEILMTFRSGKKYANDLYLQDTIGIDKDGNEITLQDKVADDSIPIDEQVEQKHQYKKLLEHINKLETREKTVIEMRYGIKTGEEVTQREVAKILGISRSYVSRIEKKAIEKLANYFKAL